MYYEILYTLAKQHYINLILTKSLKNKYIDDLVLEYDNLTLIILKNMPGCLIFQLGYTKLHSEIPTGFIVSLRTNGKRNLIGEFFFKDLECDFKIVGKFNHLKLVVDNDNNT